jgi:hypothetical protein
MTDKPTPDTDIDQGEIGKPLEPKRDPYEVIDPNVVWRGLPAFRRTEARGPRIVLDCDDEAAQQEVVEKLGLKIAKNTKGTLSAPYPPRDREDLSSLLFATEDPGSYTDMFEAEADDEGEPGGTARGSPLRPRHPVFVVSKGRWQADRALTAQTLARWRVPFRIVVEPQEADAYRRLIAGLGLDPEPVVTTLPFRDLGTSTFARAWIHEQAKAEGHARHWNLDDNIIEFRRLWYGRRIPCDPGVALRVCEDLSDRFRNVAVSGLNYQMFVPADTPKPFYTNVHVYSCTLINHAAPVEWRLRYNEDTDLCLQALTEGWCTVLLNAFMANKLRTMAMGGGNTESLYAIGEQESETDTEGRLVMAQMLADAWPGGDLVKIHRRFGRWQHSVNWGRFERQRLVYREDLPPGNVERLPEVDEYGLRLIARGEVRSPALQRLLADYPREVAA